MHSQDQDGDFALFWTSVGAQMSLLFSAEVNLQHCKNVLIYTINNLSVVLKIIIS